MPPSGGVTAIVYAKLRDFEEYLISFGVDTTLCHRRRTAPPPQRKDAALLTPRTRWWSAMRRTAVDHNIRLMHRLGREQLFASILEAARSEKHGARLRAYVSIFEEYFTYLTEPCPEGADPGLSL